MSELSDETLMAYVDGELDAADCGRIEAIATRSPDVRERIATFQATSRDALRPQHDWILKARVPDALTATVMTTAMAGAGKQTRSAPGNLTDVARVLPLRRRVSWPSALAYAASIALAIGWLGSSVLAPGRQLLVTEGGRILASGVLAQALETSLSTQPVASGWLQQSAAVTPYLTYRDKQDQYCREYEMTVAGSQTFAGIGCRGADGRWQIQANLPATARSTGTKTAPAGGPSVALEKWFDATSQGDALGAKDEAAVIAKGWR